ncbi:MAG: hypothetical protein MR025_07760 [Helicobacter trogontum]|uniref:hypothetical protein n=1 Tax=Helicobacter trogontum TaxID=50960 RepID=UPI00242ABEE2|nr:hypothetical protein [Helicobacter trogontum]MCI5787325.1 hypothetical protein [Helicobacter trogontum]
MAINVNAVPITLQKIPTANDSLKLVDMQKTFSIIDEVPAADAIATDENPEYDAQINDMLNTLKALQVAKKSLSDVQSITKDIKSNYKTEKNDAWAPVDDTMLRQRYEATLQIKDILSKATLNHKNVFTMDYAKDGITLDLGRKDMSALNLRDEHSINIFSDNIDRLSQQIEENVQKLQQKIDKINKSRWLSMENLRNVRLQQKEVNAALKAAQPAPNLASALAQISQQQPALSASIDSTTQDVSAKSNTPTISKDQENSMQQNLNTQESAKSQVENNAEKVVASSVSKLNTADSTTKSNTDDKNIESNITKSNPVGLNTESKKEDSASSNEKSSDNKDKGQMNTANVSTQGTKAKDPKDEVSIKVDDASVDKTNNMKESNDSVDKKATQDSAKMDTKQTNNSIENASKDNSEIKGESTNIDTKSTATLNNASSQKENEEQVVDVFV